jgi:hypothetical protein
VTNFAKYLASDEEAKMEESKAVGVMRYLCGTPSRMGDSTEEKLDGTLGFDSELGGNRERQSCGMSDLVQHVGEDEVAIAGTSERSFATAFDRPRTE